MVEYLTQRGWMEASSLYESPFTDFSPKGVEGVFESADVTQLIAILSDIREHATA
jgi:type I restriction enzyme, R subunit